MAPSSWHMSQRWERGGGREEVGGGSEGREEWEGEWGKGGSGREE